MNLTRSLKKALALAAVVTLPGLAFSQQGVVTSQQNPLQLALKRWFVVGCQSSGRHPRLV